MKNINMIGHFKTCDIFRKDHPSYRKIIGVYFLIKNNKVVYVGQSTNIMRRIPEHSEKVFDNFFYIEVPRLLLNRVEYDYIKHYTPCYNGTNHKTKSVKMGLAIPGQIHQKLLERAGIKTAIPQEIYKILAKELNIDLNGV